MEDFAHQNLNQPDEAQADLQKAIAFAQAKYNADSTNWYSIFNLGLYHLAAGHQQESESLYRSGLNAPQEMIEMAVRDLEELKEWRIENEELRIGETIKILNL